MMGLFGPHDGGHDTVVRDTHGNTVVYDPEFAEWYLSR